MLAGQTLDGPLATPTTIACLPEHIEGSASSAFKRPVRARGRDLSPRVAQPTVRRGRASGGVTDVRRSRSAAAQLAALLHGPSMATTSRPVRCSREAPSMARYPAAQ